MSLSRGFLREPGWPYPGWANPEPPYLPPHVLFHRRGEPSAEPAPSPWSVNPDPVPWAVAFLVATVTSKEAAANMTNKEAAEQIIAAADAAISEYIDGDDICPRWPYPGPPPWLSVIASELTLAANTLREGTLRAGILQVAGQVLDRAQTLSAGKAGPASTTRTRAA
jgi:hypothetical protein